MKLERIGSSHPWQKTLHAATIKVFIDFLFQGLGFSLLKTRKCCSNRFHKTKDFFVIHEKAPQSHRCKWPFSFSDLFSLIINEQCKHACTEAGWNSAFFTRWVHVLILGLPAFLKVNGLYMKWAAVWEVLRGDWGRLPGLADPCIVMRSDEVQKGGTRKWERTACSVFGPASEIQILYVQLSCLQVYVRAFLWC